MSRWAVVDRAAEGSLYLKADGRSWTHDAADAMPFSSFVHAVNAAAHIRLSGYPRANVAALPPAQPAQAEGEPTAHGTR